MDIIALINNLVAQLADLQVKLADAQAALDAEKKASYDIGFQQGQDSRVGEIEALKAEIEELKKNQGGDPEKVFTQADLDSAVAQAVAALKADLLAKYKAQQELESAGEKEIEDFFLA